MFNLSVLTEKKVSLFTDFIWNKIFNFYKKYNAHKKNIYISIKISQNGNFAIDLARGSEVDFIDWQNKISSGGEIVVSNSYINAVKRELKDKRRNSDEERRKELYDGIKRVKQLDETLTIMIHKALSEDKIMKHIKSFTTFVNASVEICYSYNKLLNEKFRQENYRVMRVYNANHSFGFKFDIPDDEYTNLLNKSDYEIEFGILFHEFTCWINDVSIVESQILPIYLKIVTLKELDSGNSIKIENLENWWVSKA